MQQQKSRKLSSKIGLNCFWTWKYFIATTFKSTCKFLWVGSLFKVWFLEFHLGHTYIIMKYKQYRFTLKKLFSEDIYIKNCNESILLNQSFTVISTNFVTTLWLKFLLRNYILKLILNLMFWYWILLLAPKKLKTNVKTTAKVINFKIWLSKTSCTT